MIQTSILVENQLGLHARAAARLVRLAGRFRSDIHLSRDGESQKIDSKSILGVMMLGATHGTRLVVIVSGPDEIEAANAIGQLFREKFGEEI